MRCVPWLASAALLYAGPAACARQAPRPIPSANTSADLGGDVYDPNDRCRWVPDGCSPPADGCPDVIVPAQGCFRMDPRTLDDVARDVRDEPRATRIAIVSGSVDCAQFVVARIHERGIDFARLTARVDPKLYGVAVEVDAWNGADCERTMAPPWSEDGFAGHVPATGERRAGATR